MLKDNDLFNENQETFTAIKAKSFVVTPSLPESLKDLASIMRSYPQVLVNVKVSKDGKELFHTGSCTKRPTTEEECIQMIKNAIHLLEGD